MILWLLGLSFIFQANNVYASDSVKAKIGDRYFDTLEEAILNASSTDIISLTSDISLNGTLDINKTVNINLNNHDIEAEERVFLIQGGSLNLSGKGTIKETKPNYGAINLKGSNDASKKDFSTVSIGSDITLEGWSGIFINHHNNTGYGILVNMNGKINAVNDMSGGKGAGIYVNGNIKHQDNSPIINLSDTVSIRSTGNGIYAAGYATYNINGASISGDNSGLGIKSGVFNILKGTITSEGSNKTPTTGNNNGINPSGVAIQIESNPGYSGNIELNIKDGTFSSKNSNVIYEYTVNNGKTQVKDISISGGNFTSNVDKNVFLLSDSFKINNQGFISGGTYSSNPTDYLKVGYSSDKNNDGLYKVTSSTMGMFSFNEDNGNNVIDLILSIILIGAIVITGYIKRDVIKDIFSK